MEFITDGLAFKDAKRSAVVYGGIGLAIGLFVLAKPASN